MAIERHIFDPQTRCNSPGNVTGGINAMIEKAGLRIIAQKRVMITRAQAEAILRRPPPTAVLW